MMKFAETAISALLPLTPRLLAYIFAINARTTLFYVTLKGYPHGRTMREWTAEQCHLQNSLFSSSDEKGR